MEEALTPLGIAGHGSRLVSRCECTVVKCVNIGNVEDYPPPPGQAPLGRLGDEVGIPRPSLKAGECRFFAAVQDLKPQRAVKSDGSYHFVGAQCDHADRLDHGHPCAVCSRHFSTAECVTHGLTAASWIDWIRNIRNGRSRFMGQPTRTV